MQRRVAVHVEHGGEAAVGRDEHARVHVDLALLEVPEGPHLRSSPATSSRRGSPSSSQSRGVHGPAATTTCSTAIGPARSPRAVTAPELVELEPGDLHALLDLGAGGARLRGEPEHRVAVEREAAGLLVQADAQPGRAPVGEQLAHVRRHLGLAEDQLGVVADPLLALEHRRQVRLLRAVAERDVAGAVVVRRSPGRTPRSPRRRPSAPASPAGSSCCAPRRRRCRRRRRPRRSCPPPAPPRRARRGARRSRARVRLRR